MKNFQKLGSLLLAALMILSLAACGSKGNSNDSQTDGETASGAVLTVGKRLSQNLYVTYESSLSGALGTLFIFYDLTRNLTLRGQTGSRSAVDLIYTISFD